MIPFLFGFDNSHKFYVSVTQVTYHEESSTLQVVSRIFADDLELLLKTRYNEELYLDTTKESEDADRYIEKYLHEKLAITVDGDLPKFEYIGKKYEDDLILCFLEAKINTNPQTFKVENQLFFGLFKEQQNIIHIKKRTERKSLILEKENPKGMLKFSQ